MGNDCRHHSSQINKMDQKDFMEAKHDEEQKAKLQEIFDLLMVAGYFRVRLKGLSAFDKVSSKLNI